jgi:hypothetical protein
MIVLDAQVTSVKDGAPIRVAKASSTRAVIPRQTP